MGRHKTNAYVEEACRGIQNPVLQSALANLQERFGRGTARAYQELPEGPELRFKAHGMRMAAIENLDILLETLAENVRANGGKIFFAEDADSALDYCIDVARRHKVKRVVKGKSMVTEEIGLNRFLAGHGIEAVETDLGEYIVQLAGEHPSHIIAPAVHKSRRQIGRLLADKLGIDYIEDPPALTQAARKALRQKFLAADHDVLFRLLARGAAAQNMAGYISYVGGPRGRGQADGPDEFHLVILDNGRSKILADPVFREILCCIRCGACLNICPVYAKIGGHAYGFAYSGPVGAVVTPLLTGIRQARDLCLGETLCGACKDACPVNIDIPRMLLALRAILAEGDSGWAVKPSDPAQKALFKTWAISVAQRKRYDALLAAAGVGQGVMPRSDGMLTRLPPPLDGWTRSRDIRPLAKESFNRRWKRRNQGS